MKYVVKVRNRSEFDEDYHSVEQSCIGIEKSITTGDGSADNPYIVDLKFTNTSAKTWEGILRIEFSFDKKDPRFYLPAFLYGRNRGEYAANYRWQFPRLREGKTELPYSPWWMVRSDRLSNPAALVFDKGKIFGISASPYFVTDGEKKIQWFPGLMGEFVQYAGFGCSLEDGYVAYTVGYENAPWLFVTSEVIRKRTQLNENCFMLAAGESVAVSIQVYEYEADAPSEISKAVRHVYDLYHEEPRKKSSVMQTVTDLAEAIVRDAWRPAAKNYATQVYEKENGELYYNNLFSISWTGGVEVATPILMAGLRLNSERMREQSILCIQNIVDYSINHSTGLPYDAYYDGKWGVAGWWKVHTNNKGHSSYLVGQCIYYILKAWEYEKKLRNVDHEDWMNFAYSVIEKMEQTKNGDGEYPYIWSEKSGAGLEYNAFSGAWCLACAAYLSVLTGQRKWLDDIKLSEKHYFDAYVEQMECYGTPLDTDKAVDSEGILAYLKAVRYLHMMTGEEIYLDHMEIALEYEFSFKFCYNSPIKIQPLDRIGWSSSGGSVTSTCNPHIHPMSNNVVDEILYYLEYRKDEYVEKRLRDTVLWGCQTYNLYDKEYDFGKKGWMSERFCHSEGLVIEQYPDKSPAATWFAFLPWASSNIIEGLTGTYWEMIEGK